MAETDLTAGELEIKILRKLGEDTSGSEAFPSEVIYDVMNEIYEEVFNGGNNQKNVRSAEYEFSLISDVTLDGALTAGDTSIVLSDSSELPATGRILVDNEFIDYTANDLATTLTCVASAVGQAHLDEAVVRPFYALPSGIDKENRQALIVNGIPYDPIDITDMMNSDKSNNLKYSVYDGFLLLGQNKDTFGAIFFYTPALTRVTTGTDKFTLIPNNFRVPLIANGSVGKLMMEDRQPGYEFYYRPPSQKYDKGGGLFYDNRKKFYANYGRQGSERNKKKSKSVWD